MEVASDDICRFLKQEAYHNDDPTEDIIPTFCRSSNLEAHERAISHFMPRKLIPWDPISLIGNPKKSKEVNELINGIKKFECRREGVPSQARCPIEFDEFKSLLDVTHDLSVDTDDLRRCRMASALTLQWQLIGRIDDTMKLNIDRISTNPIHAGTGNTKIEWSKTLLKKEMPQSKFFLHQTIQSCVLCLPLVFTLILSGALMLHTSLMQIPSLVIQRMVIVLLEQCWTRLFKPKIPQNKSCQPWHAYHSKGDEYLC
jgi:hypothetical protein